MPNTHPFALRGEVARLESEVERLKLLLLSSHKHLSLVRLEDVADIDPLFALLFEIEAAITARR